MQRLTYEMIGTRIPFDPVTSSEDARLRLNTIGYLDPSIILKTDNTVLVQRDRNVYTIKSNLIMTSESSTVSDSATITLSKPNFGIQELLVDTGDIGNPGYVEVIDFSTTGNIITLDSQDFNGNAAFIKYLSTN